MKTKTLLFYFILILLTHNQNLQSQICKTVHITNLENTVSETSGLLFYDGKIWTHNDSGGKPELYQIDTNTGLVVETKELLNAKNIDWEDICKDDKFAYIADFGNNRGNRSKLQIYRIELNELNCNKTKKLKTEIINYSYPSEHYVAGKTNKKRRTNFDCEAIISFQDSLYLFTKNWGNHKTYLYSLPNKPGEHVASLRDSLNVKALICGADYNAETNSISLIGYVYGIPAPSVLIILNNFESDNFFYGNYYRQELDLLAYQTEGIVFLSSDTLLISNENFYNNTQSIRQIILSKTDSNTNDKNCAFSSKMIAFNKKEQNISIDFENSDKFKITLLNENLEELKTFKKKRNVPYCLQLQDFKDIDNLSFIQLSSRTATFRVRIDN